MNSAENNRGQKRPPPCDGDDGGRGKHRPDGGKSGDPLGGEWPPKIYVAQDDGSIANHEIILPSELYWKYVRPFTPQNSRPILNKRTGSTQFYHGERVKIDQDFLSRGGEWGMKHILGFTGIPTATGSPGTTSSAGSCYNRGSFQMHFDGRCKFDSKDPATALEGLRNARVAWDEHISLITSPSTRLHACLELFLDDAHPDFPVEIPLLFPGKGEIKDVVEFHMSMNLSSTNGPAEFPTFRPFQPNSILGYYVNIYLSARYSDMCDGICSSQTDKLGAVVDGLMDAGASVAPFFKELPQPNAISVLPYLAQHYPERGSTYIQRLENVVESYIADAGEEEEVPEILYYIRSMVNDLKARMKEQQGKLKGVGSHGTMN